MEAVCRAAAQVAHGGCMDCMAMWRHVGPPNPYIF